MRIARLHRKKKAEEWLDKVASRLGIRWLLREPIRTVSFVRSTYGPWLYNTPDDRTFELCVNGYGAFVAEAIESWDSDFLFLDIGANLGLFSLVAVQNPHCRHAFAFEPLPEIFRRLKLNIARNNSAKIAPIQGAVVNSTVEEVRLTFNPRHSGMSKIATDERCAVRSTAISAPELDAIIPRSSLPILAKIDVEGSELDVLSVLRRTHFCGRIEGLVLEVSEQNLGSARRRQLLDALSVEGFGEVGRAGRPEHYDALYRRSAKRSLQAE